MHDKRSDDVVLSSRVRLARNFEEIPFPAIMNDVFAQESIRHTMDAMADVPDGKDYSLLRLSEMGKHEAQCLVERHLISLDLINHADVAAVLLNADKGISIMVNEEDHLRIQVLTQGNDLEHAARCARTVDDGMESSVHFAFDNQLGYLTACPTNTGTGMRASQMLHMPALTVTRKMGAVGQAVAKLGLTIRGLYGEGSEALGNLYQISNQVTLGRTEKELVDTVSSVGKQLAEMERNARIKLVNSDMTAVEDQLMRSFGILLYAKRLSAREFMQRWSDIKLASSFNLISTPGEQLDTLLYTAQDGNVLYAADNELSTLEVDVARAKIVQDALALEGKE